MHVNFYSESLFFKATLPLSYNGLCKSQKDSIKKLGFILARNKEDRKERKGRRKQRN